MNVSVWLKVSNSISHGFEGLIPELQKNWKIQATGIPAEKKRRISLSS